MLILLSGAFYIQFLEFMMGLVYLAGKPSLDHSVLEKCPLRSPSPLLCRAVATPSKHLLSLANVKWPCEIRPPHSKPKQQEQQTEEGAGTDRLILGDRSSNLSHVLVQPLREPRFSCKHPAAWRSPQPQVEGPTSLC